MLNSAEEKRYLRQLILEDFGIEAQEKLKNSTVVIIGLGGLGSPVALYLAAAGVGKIIVCDNDTVELSNLNRQILHCMDDIDVAKSDSCFDKLSNLNPTLSIEAHQIKIDELTINRFAKNANLIIDCLDNIKTRLDINRYSVKNHVPIVHAGISGWNGQLTFLNPPETPCLNCLFQNYIEPEGPKPVIGAVAGILGSSQALCAINYLAGKNTSLKNQLLFFDGRNMEFTKVEIEKDPECKVCSKY